MDKWISGYEGRYIITDKGEVFSYFAGYRKKLKPGRYKNSYKQVVLSLDGDRKRIAIHRLVAQAFIPNPDNLPQVNHLDENKTNNNLSNLEWCDNYHNYKHSEHNQLRGEKPVIQLTLDGKFIARFKSQNEAARKTLCNQAHIGKCIDEKRKTHGGYKWETA